MAEVVREMLVSHDPNETRVALLENGDLVELYVERTKRSVVGNIYLGKVKDVLPGMQAAFVDIGLEKNAFLYVDDARALGSSRSEPSRDIGSLVTPGGQVLVQVSKDPMGTKGARITADITLPGRFVVFTPFSDSVTASRRLSLHDRERLHGFVSANVPKGVGAIVRTVAAEASEGEIVADLEFLSRLWKRVSRQADEALAPEVVYTEMDLALRLVRDVFSASYRRLVVDDPVMHTKIVSFLKKVSPHLVRHVSLFKERTPSLFNSFGLAPTIESATRRIVELPSGAHITVDRTEALTVIDVNSGRYVGRKNLEDTVVRINLEAADEVARQLRLRDIGGIIVVDFIDMEEASSRARVMERFTEAVGRDRTRTRVLEMSRLGLVEMTRKNVTDGLFGVMTETCPRCEGQGRIISAATMLIDAERRLEELLRASRATALLVAVHPETYQLLTAPGTHVLGRLRAETNKQLELAPEPSCDPLEVRVLIEGRRGVFERAFGGFRRR